MLSEHLPIYPGGTGTGDMIRRCREAGLREPRFEMADGFTLTLWRTRDAAAGAGASGKRTSRAIEMQINRLKADKIVGRIGPAKGGHGEVLS